MVYQANCDRLKPLVNPVWSLLSTNIDGTLDNIQLVGVETSILSVAFSKSSRYEALSCTPWFCPAMSWANSPENEMDEGWVSLRNGMRSSTLVSHWLSFFQLTFKPHRVLLSGSIPIDTLVLRGCSERCCSVPDSWKLLEKSYSQFMPSMVLRSCMYSDWLSNDTFTAVPASMILWLRMVTSPAL